MMTLCGEQRCQLMRYCVEIKVITHHRHGVYDSPPMEYDHNFSELSSISPPINSYACAKLILDSCSSVYHGDGAVAVCSCLPSLRFLGDGKSTLHDAGREPCALFGSAADAGWGASTSIVWGMVQRWFGFRCSFRSVNVGCWLLASLRVARVAQVKSHKSQSREKLTSRITTQNSNFQHY